MERRAYLPSARGRRHACGVELSHPARRRPGGSREEYLSASNANHGKGKGDRQRASAFLPQARIMFISEGLLTAKSGSPPYIGRWGIDAAGEASGWGVVLMLRRDSTEPGNDPLAAALILRRERKREGMSVMDRPIRKFSSAKIMGKGGPLGAFLPDYSYKHRSQSNRSGGKFPSSRKGLCSRVAQAPNPMDVHGTPKVPIARGRQSGHTRFG